MRINPQRLESNIHFPGASDGLIMADANPLSISPSYSGADSESFVIMQRRSHQLIEICSSAKAASICLMARWQPY